MEIETKILQDGIVVLAKKSKYGLSAVTYANNTQANNKVTQLRAAGINCFPIGFRPILIRIETDKPITPAQIAIVKPEWEAMQALLNAPTTQQSDMFTATCDDLPLFSGTPVTVKASVFAPAEVSAWKQGRLTL